MHRHTILFVTAALKESFWKTEAQNNIKIDRNKIERGTLV